MYVWFGRHESRCIRGSATRFWTSCCPGSGTSASVCPFPPTVLFFRSGRNCSLTTAPARPKTRVVYLLAPSSHQRRALSSLAAIALQRRLAPRHYRICRIRFAARHDSNNTHSSAAGSDGAHRTHAPAPASRRHALCTSSRHPRRAADAGHWVMPLARTRRYAVGLGSAMPTCWPSHPPVRPTFIYRAPCAPSSFADRPIKKAHCYHSTRPRRPAPRTMAQNTTLSHDL